MARKIAPLTVTKIKAAKPKAKEYNLSDGDGLAIRIKPNGSKLWIYNYYRPYTKKRANIGFGSFPALSLADARRKRHEAQELLSRNIDPKTFKEQQEQKKKDELNATFGALAGQWLELKRQHVKPDTAEKAFRTLEKHILPYLYDVPISHIKPKTIIEILEPVKAKGSYETIKRLCRIINEVMRLAVVRGLIEVNYLSDITKVFPAAKRKNMATLPPERLAEFMAKVNAAQITRTTQCLLEWQLHTMTRPIEAATAEWEHIDLIKKVWFIPADRMKMNRPHTIPLSKQSLELLDVMKPISGNRQYVFPSHRSPNKHANSQTVNMALKRMGLAGEIVSHGMRALASTTLNEQGFDPDVIDSALAHVDRNEVRRAYNRAEYLERRRKLMDWWSNHIEQASVGNLSSTRLKHLQVVN